MVDVLLGLLSQSSLLWRSVVDQVFRRIVHRMTPGVVELIANVRGERGRGEGVREWSVFAGASATDKRRANGRGN